MNSTQTYLILRRSEIGVKRGCQCQALRFVLIISFGGAIFFLLLQFFWQPALLVALMILIEGVFVAVQMERVR